MKNTCQNTATYKCLIIALIGSVTGCVDLGPESYKGTSYIEYSEIEGCYYKVNGSDCLKNAVCIQDSNYIELSGYYSWGNLKFDTLTAILRHRVPEIDGSFSDNTTIVEINHSNSSDFKTSNRVVDIQIITSEQFNKVISISNKKYFMQEPELCK